MLQPHGWDDLEIKLKFFPSRDMTKNRGIQTAKNLWSGIVYYPPKSFWPDARDTQIPLRGEIKDGLLATGVVETLGAVS